jgi:predicted short-subunit dehydrogenase-like oxidoreductase (DUF2520 family)
MKVVIVGTGNVATVLGQRILEVGNEIAQVVGRTEEKAAALASALRCTYSTNYANIDISADLYIISVADNVIKDVAEKLLLGNRLVVHTAAAVSKDVLSNSSTNYGVLYPLQTLKAGLPNIPPIPVAIDGSSPNVINTLKSFAGSWAESVVVASDEERLKVHVGAVFVSNFTNHIFALVSQYFKEENLNFKSLQRLIEETIRRVATSDPKVVQTGPAIRNDTDTINRHKVVLGTHPQLLKVYKELTDSIFRMYSENIS